MDEINREIIADKAINDILTVTSFMSDTCQIFLYDDIVMLSPVPEIVKKTLTIRVKTLECSQRTKWKRELVYTTRELFTLITRNGQQVLVTYQGFCHELILLMITNNIKFSYVDWRTTSIELGDFPEPELSNMYGFRFSQQKLLENSLKCNKSGLIGAPTRYGKSLSAGTKVLMHDYTIKVVEDIVVGDKLMGVRGKPRTVVTLGTGIEASYNVSVDRGCDFKCNESHILSLKVVEDDSDEGLFRNDIVNITVKDYLGKSEAFKRKALLWYDSAAPYNYTDELGTPEHTLDASGITANRTKLISKGRGFIQKVFTSTHDCRVQLLDYIVDKSAKVHKGFLTISTDCPELAQDIVRLGRGLGFEAYPAKKNPNVVLLAKNLAMLGSPKAGKARQYITFGYPDTSTFTLEPIGDQRYYGFELEGPDKLYLLWDHLVTHNTTLIINTLRAFPNLTTVVTAPGVDLVKQLYADITGERGIKGREVKLICSGSRVKFPSDQGITVCSMDSLEKCNYGKTKLLLCDEPHAAVAESRLRKLSMFNVARRYGFGATLKGRFDNKDKLITGIFGPVLSQVTYKEAVAEGAVCQLHILALDISIQPAFYKDRDDAYNHLLFSNTSVANTVSRICSEVIPEDWQTMIFIKRESQAEVYLEALGPSTTVAMAKKLNKKEREEVDSLMKSNTIKRCLCSDIYVQGVTFSDVRVLINAAGGGNNTTAIQKPGRVAEIRPNKDCGIIIDLHFVPAYGELKDYKGEAWTCLCSESASRLKAYEECGYIIHSIQSIEQLKEVFTQLM